MSMCMSVCVCCMRMHVHARSLIIRQHDMALLAAAAHIVLSLRINLCELSFYSHISYIVCTLYMYISYI